MLNEKKQSSSEIMDEKKGSGFTKTHALILVLIVVIILVAVIIWLLLRPEPQTNNRVVTEENINEIAADVQKTVDEGLFNVRMNTEWSFSNSHATSPNAYVANSELNGHAIYFDVILDGTGETIFTSPKMKIGTKLENLTLNCDLAAGTYPATVMYHLLNDDDSERSSVGISITLTIQN